MRTKHLIASAVMISLAVVEFSVFRDLDLQAGRIGGPAAAEAAPQPSAGAPAPPAWACS